MNRKGFTLIEVLGTLTILGIISVVAVPMVNKYLMQSKDKTYDNYVNTLYNATRNYYEKNSMFLPKADTSSKVTARELLNDDYIDELIDPETRNAPEQKDRTCDYDKSFVVVKNNTKSGSKVRSNADLEFHVTLVCHKKTIEDEVIE